MTRLPKMLYRFAWIPVLLFGGILAAFWITSRPLEPGATATLAICFSNVGALAAVQWCARRFCARSEPGVLWLGYAGLLLGVAGGLVAHAVLQFHSANTIIHAVGIGLAGACLLLGAALVHRQRTLCTTVLCRGVTYGAGPLLIVLSMAALYKGWLPFFLVPAANETFVWQVILGAGIGLLGVTAELLASENRRAPTVFLQWYVLGLVLLVISLAGQLAHSGPLQLVGLSAQILGGLYLLIAVITSVRESGAWTIKLAKDLAEARRAQRASEERMRLALAAGQMATWDWHMADGRLVWNDNFYKMLGYEPGSVTPSYQLFLDRVHPADRAAVAATMQRSVSTAGDYVNECRLIWPDGSVHWLESRGYFEHDAAGRPSRSYGVMLDITAHNLASEKLCQSEMHFRGIFENAGSGIALVDCAGRFTKVNPAFCAIIGYTEQELYTMSIADIVPPDDQTNEMARFLQCMADQSAGFSIEKLCRHKTGRDVWIELHATFIRDQNGQSVINIGMVQDITKRRQAEQQLQAAVMEKEVLLKEIHHRVKNNLQVISSLVSLQACSLDGDSKLHVMLDDVRDRIRTMALVHETLYQTGDLAQLNLADYITRLLQSLWQAHSRVAATVQLNLAVAPLILPVDTALPCGLILNELASNALKHAFPSGRNGHVTVGAAHDSATGTATLWVHDDGVGLPVGRDWRTGESLGLRLVQILARQLRGTVTVGSGPGTQFQVAFPLK